MIFVKERDNMMNATRIAAFLFLLVIGCQKDHTASSIDHAPEWLQAKLDTMSSYEEYEGTTLYRYKWNGADIYHFEIPNSTCLYCEMYTQGGDKIFFASETEFQDFLKTKKDSSLIWEWTGRR
jgi:hypothetical protein